MGAFPVASIRDNVRAQRQLLEHLGVCRVAIAIGGSLGGMLALEWIATYPAFVERAVIIAACAAHP
jgi:homoserine acetyltransferase